MMQDKVATSMLAHTPPLGTPLSTETDRDVRLVGTGDYVMRHDKRLLITCEHVARVKPIHYRLYGSDNVFAHQGPGMMDQHPVDTSFAEIGDAAWAACEHQAATIPYDRFAANHHLAQPEELIFYRGYAGENAHYAFGQHQTNATGYCTQEKKDTSDGEIFELFWEPEHIQFASGTLDEVKAAIKLDDARGFSGSLVWNTRYLEVTNIERRKWSPEDAVVTGLLRRWDRNTRSLLVWRVEHLRAWLDKNLL
jgi:hypothetical protein